MKLFRTIAAKMAEKACFQLPTRPRSSRQTLLHNRQGTLLLEVVVASVLLASLLVLINQVLVRTHAQVDLVDERLEAQQFLENLLEEISSYEWNSINTESIQHVDIPDSVANKLSGLALRGSVTEQVEPVVAKRITLELDWTLVSGRRIQPIRLSTWVYKRPEVER